MIILTYRHHDDHHIINPSFIESLTLYKMFMLHIFQVFSIVEKCKRCILCIFSFCTLQWVKNGCISSSSLFPNIYNDVMHKCWWMGPPNYFLPKWIPLPYFLLPYHYYQKNSFIFFSIHQEKHVFGFSLSECSVHKKVHTKMCLFFFPLMLLQTNFFSLFL